MRTTRLSPTLNRMSDEVWALVVMMLLLKIPVIYLGWVVWYAIKAEPEPGVDPHESSAWKPSPWKPWSRSPRTTGPRADGSRRGGPHGRRGGARAARAARRGRVGA
jgi:hypothetical protein